MAVRTVRVAGVQVESRNGEVEANLARAEPWVARAAERGAALVLCPEFLAAGYVYDESIWRSGERRGGPTERFLQRSARAHGVHVGASYLEARGDDFYNTFALAAPDGSIAGRVSKESLPFFEGWYFKSCAAPKAIDTALGRIGVGICQDNHTTRYMRRVADDGIDLLLMPHSGPCIAEIPFASRGVRSGLRRIAPFYARALGVPVVMVNKWSTTPSRSPIPVAPLVRLRFDFPGLSTIADAGGAVVDHLAKGEGIVVGDVRLDPAARRRPDVPSGYWSQPPPAVPRIASALFQFLERAGARAYTRSEARARAARAVRDDDTT